MIQLKYPISRREKWGLFFVIGGRMKKNSHFPILVCFLIITSMVLFGCGAAQRNKLKNQYYDSWPPHIQQAVDNNEVVIGMDKLQVQISTGVSESLIDKRVNVSENGYSETWVLWKFMGMWGYYPAGGAGKMILIHFNRNGRVDSLSY